MDKSQRNEGWDILSTITYEHIQKEASHLARGHSSPSSKLSKNILHFWKRRFLRLIIVTNCTIISKARYYGNLEYSVANRFLEWKEELGPVKFDAGACKTEKSPKNQEIRHLKNGGSCGSGCQGKSLKLKIQVKQPDKIFFK